MCLHFLQLMDGTLDCFLFTDELLQHLLFTLLIMGGAMYGFLIRICSHQSAWLYCTYGPEVYSVYSPKVHN